MRISCRRLRHLGRCLALAAAALAAGCGKDHNPIAMVAETDEAQYQYGEQMLREERPDDALTAFLGVIKSRADDAPESHLEAGRIYLTGKKDPLAAIYHFKAYLVARPNADQAPMVKELIDTATKDFARSLPGAPNLYDESDLVDQIKTLTTDNENLRHQLGLGPVSRVPVTSLESISKTTVVNINSGSTNTNTTRPSASTPLPAPPPTPVTVTATPAPTVTTPAVAASGRTYTVVKDDTLSSISMKVFGTRSRWQEIYNLNRDQLPKPESLHIGQVLKLPAQ